MKREPPVETLATEAQREVIDTFIETMTSVSKLGRDFALRFKSKLFVGAYALTVVECATRLLQIVESLLRAVIEAQENDRLRSAVTGTMQEVLNAASLLQRGES